MKYTTEQYRNMVAHVSSDIMDAELHNGRIINRLEGEPVTEKHQELQKVLLEAVRLITEIEDLL